MSYLKLTQLEDLGIVAEKTLDDMYVDVGQIVTSDEFDKRTRRGDNEKDYRERAIDRLMRYKLDFQTNANIIYDLVRRTIKMDCPICFKGMTMRGGGGSAQMHIIDYDCPEHHVRISLSLPSDGISFTWRKEK